MKQKILFVAHCILNTCSKVVMYNTEEMAREEALRKELLIRAIEGDVQLVQLPCPEQSLYGSCRWGHTGNQFDNPYFRSHCRGILAPILLDLEEYTSHPERFEVLGIVGIDGSPSCGVDYTCSGPWGGNLSGRDDLEAVIGDVTLVPGPGIFIQELIALLERSGLQTPLVGLFAPEPQKAKALIP